MHVSSAKFCSIFGLQEGRIDALLAKHNAVLEVRMLLLLLLLL
jgi:hypothetical protein